MKVQYIIYDWAGNKPFGDKTFNDFEDAWSYIYASCEQRYGVPQNEQQENELDQILGEFSVEQLTRGGC